MENIKSNKLLMDEKPLVVLPRLAELVGLNEALILQQIHFWCYTFSQAKKRDHYQGDRWWCFNSIREWQTNFPFWSQKTIQRAITSLRKRKLVLVSNYNKMKYDRTLWYSVDYDALERLVNWWDDAALGQNDLMEPSGQNDSMPLGQNDLMDRDDLTQPIPENNHTKEIWNIVLLELSSQMTRNTFSTWLAGSHLISLENGAALVQVKDMYTAEWCACRLINPILRTMRSVANDDSLIVSFTDGTTTYEQKTL